MKKAEIVFSSILVPIDYILLILAGLSAYFLRYSDWYAKYIREVVFSLSFFEYFKYVAWIALGWLLIFALTGLYSMHAGKKAFRILRDVFLACSTSSLIVILALFFSRELFSSRFIILASWLLAVVYVSAAHLFVRYIQRLFYKKGVGVHKVIFVGGGQMAEILLDEFKHNFKLGYQVIYQTQYLTPDNLEHIRQLAKNREADEIIQANADLNRQKILSLLDIANEYHLEFKYAADLLGARRSNVEIYTINGIPLVEIKKTPLDGWGRVVKRLFDIFGSIFFLILFSPLFLIVPILIKLDSPGPVFYKSLRIGAKGKKFYLYKFRTMIDKADQLKVKLLDKNERQDGPLFKMQNDPRVTRLGKILRRTSIDEMPNFWNVLWGNMSLVGPRPHEPHEVARYQKHHKKLLNIKPGITGMAQVSGRSKLDFESEVKLDTLYIEKWSWWLDMIILFKTPLILLKFID